MKSLVILILATLWLSLSLSLLLTTLFPAIEEDQVKADPIISHDFKIHEPSLLSKDPKKRFGWGDGEDKTLSGPIDGGLPIVSVTDATCFEANDGTASATPNGGTPPWYYLWSTGETTALIENLAPGDYSLTITDEANNFSSENFTIGPVEILLSFNVTNESSPGAMDGSIDLTATGGSSIYGYPFSFEWSNGSITEDLTNLFGGQTYSVTVTDYIFPTQTVGCMKVDEIFVPTDLLCPTILDGLVISDVTCFDAGNGSASVDPTGGLEPYTIGWSNGDMGSNTNTLDPGAYVVTITDYSGCQIISNFNISEPPLLNSSLTSTDESVPDASDGSVDLNVIGGTNPYLYSWTNGATTQDLSALIGENTIYVVTITDSKGCQITNMVTLQTGCFPSGTPCDDADQSTYNDVEDGNCNCTGIACAILTDGLFTSDITCFGAADGIASVQPSGGMGPYIINWSNGASGNFVNALGPGSYTVTITDDDGCVEISDFTISEHVDLTTTLVGIDESLPGAADGAAELTVTGGVPPYSYSWSNGTTSEDLIGLTGENLTYTVTITDDRGCQKVDQVTILTGCLAPGTTCNDDDPNTYDDVQDGNCNCLGTPCASINLNFFMANVSCFAASDANASVNPFGGLQPYDITWSNGSTSLQVDNLSPSNYTVSVIDQSGCKVSRHFVITEPDELKIVLAGLDETSTGAANGAIDLMILGGSYPYDYLWSNGSTTQDIHNLDGGGMQYSVTVTDAQGCKKSDSVLIFTGCLPNGTPCDDADPLTYDDQQDGNCACNGIPCSRIELNTTKNNLSCAGTIDGKIILSPSGGQKPYTFIWSNGSVDSATYNLSEGLYFVTVSDASGCGETSFFQISEPDPLQLRASISPATSILVADASIELKITGGTPPYSVTWLDGPTDPSRQHLLPGAYEVKVVDHNGCTKRDTFIVTEICPEFAQPCDDGDLSTVDDRYDESCNCVGIPCGLEVIPQLTHVSCYGMPSGAAFIDTSGLSILAINWSTGASGDQILDLAAGVYQLTVTFDAGCTSELSLEILQSDFLTLELYGADETGSAAANGYAGVNIIGGTAPFHILWSTGDSISLIENLIGNQYYKVEITDAGGCMAIDSIFVAEFVCASLQEGAFIPKISTKPDCGEQSEITIEVQNGYEGNFEYSLDGITFQLSPIFSGVDEGIFTSVVRDRTNGCHYLLSEVKIGSTPNLNLLVRQPSSCNSPDGAIETISAEYQIGLNKDGPRIPE
ncbi:MAG: SprB repeat-containing protein [Saprospiraceae bacterium]|nr:SprB repeat-containing protein [Saprospiraceae bacterium]